MLTGSNRDANEAEPAIDRACMAAGFSTCSSGSGVEPTTFRELRSNKDVYSIAFIESVREPAVVRVSEEYPDEKEPGWSSFLRKREHVQLSTAKVINTASQRSSSCH